MQGERRPTRLSFADSATSSISAIAGKPPTRSNASRVTNIAWSPVAMPVSRERKFIMSATNGEQAAAVEAAHRNGPSAADAASAVEHQAVGIVRQPRVGMQEQQHIAASQRRRRHSSARRVRAARQITRSASGRASSTRAVAAAAIGHDHLDAARAIAAPAPASAASMPAASSSTGMMMESVMATLPARRAIE